MRQDCPSNIANDQKGYPRVALYDFGDVRQGSRRKSNEKPNTRKVFCFSRKKLLQYITIQVKIYLHNRTMLAEEFRQSQSCESNYTSDFSLEEVEEDED